MASRILVGILLALVSASFQLASAQATTEPSSQTPGNAVDHNQSAPRVATAELERRAKTGDAAAQNELGLRYLRGIDVDKDPAEALQWFRKAAVGGHPAALFNLGAAYYNGTGVRTNDEEACKWFLLASDAGFGEAKEAVERCGRELTGPHLTNSEVLAGDAYLRGNEVKQNLNRAAQLYQKAFAAGSAAAADRIGVMYADGLMFAQDMTQALEWLNKSAKLGYAQASYQMGLIYEKGSGSVAPDVKRAASLYRQAAERLDPTAMMAIGRLYATGSGVRQSNQEAYRWYYLAWKYDAPGAQEAQDAVAASLSAKQIADIKKGKK